MKIINLKCPNCGASLHVDASDTDVTCEYCKSTFHVDNEMPKKDNAPIYENDYMYQKQQNIKGSARKVMLVILLAFCIPIISVLFSIASSSSGYKTTYSTEVKADKRTKIQSKGAQELISSIFGKDVSDITKTELQTLTYLRIEGNEDFKSTNIGSKDILKVSYSFTSIHDDAFNSTIRSFWIEKDEENFELDDLQLLSGLQSLYILGKPYKSDSVLDVNALKQLERIGIDEVYSREVTSFSNPKKIKEASLSLFYEENFEKVLSFENLETLTIPYISSSLNQIDFTKLSKLKHLKTLNINYADGDISFISKLDNLTSLRIRAMDSVTDFEFLNDIKNLETLTLEAKNLRNLNFLENNPNLKTLKLEDTSINSIEPLRGKTGLTSLSIVTSNSGIDMSPITSLTNLTSLELSNATNLEEGSLSGLNLQSASVNNDGLKAIYGCQSLHTLIVERVNDEDVAKVASFPNVKNITIDGEANFNDISGLANASGIETLTLKGFDYFDMHDSSFIFNFPNMKELSIYDSNIGITRGVISNPSLEVLRIANCEVSIYENGEKQTSGEHSLNLIKDELSRLSNLKTLYVPGNNFDNLDFISSLSNLEYVDISYAYATDISPLEGLMNLKLVNIKNTNIKKSEVLKSKAYILK